MASLLFPTDYPTHFRLKPELHHVCTPKGIEVTGSHEYCFIHHMSINCGHGKVQVDGDPTRFFVPPYVGQHGWIGIYLDIGADLDRDHVIDLIEESYRMTAPKRLVKAMDEGLEALS